MYVLVDKLMDYNIPSHIIKTIYYLLNDRLLYIKSIDQFLGPRRTSQGIPHL